MPAFDTSTSTGPPNSSSMAAKAASTWAPSVTSHLTANSSSGGGELLKVTATRSPRARKRSAHARPMPREPPVTKTTRGVPAASVIQATTPSQHARGGGHAATEPNQQHEVAVGDATVVERVGERQGDRRRRRVAGLVEHDGSALHRDAEPLAGGVDDADVGLVGDDHRHVVGG